MSEAMIIVKSSFLIAWRHYRIFRRDFFANISPTLVEPFFYVLVFGYWFGRQVPVEGNLTYMEFMAPGIAAMAALFSAFFDGSYGFYVRLELEHVFKALLTTPVGPFDILVGELIWLAAKSAIMSTVVSIVLGCLGVVSFKFMILIPIVGALTGLSCGAIGLISSTYVNNINQFQIVYAWIISPMFFTSGMFAPDSSTPIWVQRISWISPFYHSVKIAQATLWGRDVLHIWLTHGTALCVLTAGLIYWCRMKIIPRLSA